ncbi:EO4 [Micropterus dolomieu adomavirus 2]|uniref:EO4 n=1 Tax=Micropterus dolomieu adomavirus 2 TaxID=2681676 RepID=A0A650BUS0_9VIRU|nr:EO4 [Micropterus dolomieu adomavirus 2]
MFTFTRGVILLSICVYALMFAQMSLVLYMRNTSQQIPNIVMFCYFIITGLGGAAICIVIITLCQRYVDIQERYEALFRRTHVTVNVLEENVYEEIEMEEYYETMV